MPLARYAAIALGAGTALVLIANPATRVFAWFRRRSDPDFPDDLPLLFDVNTELNVPTWWSAGLLLAAAGAAGLLAAVRKTAGAGGGGRLAILAVVLAGMSLDETAALHERLDTVVTGTLNVEPTGALRHPWVVAGVFLAAALAVVVVRALVALPRRLRFWVALGFGIFVGGALGLETVSAAVLDSAGDGVAYGAVTWGEEGAEMIGAVIVCTALLAGLDVRVVDGSLRIRPAQPARHLASTHETSGQRNQRTAQVPVPERSEPASVDGPAFASDD